MSIDKNKWIKVLSDYLGEKRAEKFTNSVELKENECIEWTAGKSSDGYGSFYVNNKLEKTHRITARCFIRPAKDDEIVCHSCDNTKCLNPDHLFYGTYKDNNQDRAKKGRNRNQNGNKNNMSKLTENQIGEIKHKLNEGKLLQREIAEQYGVTQVLISKIKLGKLWSWLK